MTDYHRIDDGTEDEVRAGDFPILQQVEETPWNPATRKCPLLGFAGVINVIVIYFFSGRDTIR